MEERIEDDIVSDFSGEPYTSNDAANRLSYALQKADTTKFMYALDQLARKHGVTALARDVGLSRTSLYRILSKDDSLRLSTLVALLSALSLRMVVEPLVKDDANDPPTRR
jgi:probable addiction module antidote protein